MTRIIITKRNFSTVYDIETTYSPVLTARRTMEVNDELKVMIRCPGNGLLQVIKLASYVRFSCTDFKCPVANRQTDMVQAVKNFREISVSINKNVPCRRNSFKVIFGDPRIPMVLQGRLSSVVVLLAEGPLINDATVTDVLEYTGRDPRLETNKKRTEATFECLTSRTSQPPRLTPRTFLEP